ncbi:MAG: MFS transporter [Betaproteobacteria bacterium]|nr:MFS transporter [Betaproteobacteria bacterium]
MDVAPTAAAPTGRRLLAMVFLPFAAAYYVSFLFRNVNSVVFPELTQEFDLSAGALGFLTSVYFLTFGGAQLPLGILMDRYGPRRVNATMLLVAALGAVVFASAAGLSGLVLGRALIGLGVAVCLMSAMTAFVLWFPLERMATLVGWMLLVGAIGALSATKPVELALRVIDWRTLFVALAGYTVCASLAILCFVPEKARPPVRATLRRQIAEVGTILRNRGFWSVGLVAACQQGVALSLLGLWAGPWMRDVADLDRVELAQNLLFAAGAFGVGAVLCGSLSDRLTLRGVPPLLTYLTGCIACTVAMIPIVLGFGSASLLLWILYMGLASFGALSYALLAGRFPKEMAGRVVTALNMVTFLLAFGVQAGVGAIINLWPVVDGRYAFEGYRTAFGLCWLLQVASVAWLAYAERRNLRGQTTYRCL